MITKFKLYEFNDLDPYGEENWNDANWDLEDDDVGYDENIVVNDIHEILDRRGDDMVARWRGNVNNRKLLRFWDRKVCDYGEDFPGLEEYEDGYPDNAGSLTLSDYLEYKSNDVAFYTCPKCLKKSKNSREHGEGWICGSCGLKSRNWGNGLYVWE